MKSNRAYASRVANLTLAAVMAVAVSAQGVSAGTLTGSAPTAGVVLSNELSGQTGVQYTFNLAPATTASTIRCFTLQAQSPQGTNALPDSMSVSGAGGGTTTGLGGTTYTADVTGAATGLLKYTHATGSTPTNPISLNVTGLTNPTLPSGAQKTYFWLVKTFTDTACSAPSSAGTDSGTMAFVITDASNSNVTVTGTLGQTLTMSLSTNALSFASNLSNTIQTVTGNFSVSTNAVNGYAVYANGTTLTSGSNTIPFTAGAMANGNVSAYGLNVSTCPSGGSGVVTCRPSDFGVATAPATTKLVDRTAASSGDTATITYKAQAANTQAPGTYTSTINYIASGQF